MSDANAGLDGEIENGLESILPPSPAQSNPSSDHTSDVFVGTATPNSDVAEEKGDQEGSVSTYSSEKSKRRRNHRGGAKNREKGDRKADFAVLAQHESPGSSVSGAKKSYRAGVQVRRRREQRKLYRMTSQGMEPLDGASEYGNEKYDDDYEEGAEGLESSQTGADSNEHEKMSEKDLTQTETADDIIKEDAPRQEVLQEVVGPEEIFERVDVTPKFKVEIETHSEEMMEPVDVASRELARNSTDLEETFEAVDVTHKYATESVAELEEDFEPVDVTQKYATNINENTEVPEAYTSEHDDHQSEHNTPSLTYDSDDHEDNHSEHEAADDEPLTQDIPGSPFSKLNIREEENHTHQMDVEGDETAQDSVKEKPVVSYVPAVPSEVKAVPAVVKPPPKPAVRHSVQLLSLMRPILNKN